MTSFEAMATFPKGLILMWWAKGGELPSGWAMCDGNNGTPDLRDKFVRSVSDFADVGKPGGVSEHNIQISDHHHNIAKGSKENAMRAEAGGGVMTHTTVADYLYNTYTEVNKGFEVKLDNNPPYETVLFIMKV